MQHRVFTAFFVIQHKLQRDARLAGPGRMGRLAAVTDEIARVRGAC